MKPLQPNHQNGCHPDTDPTVAPDSIRAPITMTATHPNPNKPTTYHYHSQSRELRGDNRNHIFVLSMVLYISPKQPHQISYLATTHHPCKGHPANTKLSPPANTTHIHTRTHAYTSTHAHMLAHPHTHTCLHIHTRTHAYTSRHAHIQTRTHPDTHTHTMAYASLLIL